MSKVSSRSTAFGRIRYGVAALSVVWGFAVASLVTLSIFVIIGYPALVVLEDTGLARRETIVGMSAVVALLTGVITCVPRIVQWAGGYRVVLDATELVVEHVFGKETFSLGGLDWIAEYDASAHEHGLCLSHEGRVFLIADACLSFDAQVGLRAELHRMCAAGSVPFERFDYVPRSSSFHPLRAFHAGAFDFLGGVAESTDSGVITRPSLVP